MIDKTINYVVSHIFEPSLNWAMAHPVISLVLIGAMLFFAVRNYRML